MSDVRFRRARPEDAEEILSIKRDAIEDLEHWQYSPEQVQAWKPKDSYADTFAEAIDDDRFVVHVGEREGRIAGYGALNVPDERIDAVYVHPDHHGQGVATALVKQLELSARFQGIEEIDIVAARNAVPFYESVGYWRLDDEVTTIDDVDVAFGDSVHFDVVTEGHKYGLRSPGNRAVYTATDGPDSSLADIARSLEE